MDADPLPQGVNFARRNTLGFTARDLVDGEIAFGDTSWIIKTVLEQGQELRLILIQSS